MTLSYDSAFVKTVVEWAGNVCGVSISPATVTTVRERVREGWMVGLAEAAVPNMQLGSATVKSLLILKLKLNKCTEAVP